MSEVNANDLTLISHADDVFDLYTGSPSKKAGIEVELAFFNPETNDLDVMSLPQNKVLKNSAMAVYPEVDWVHNEPTSELLEVASQAHSYDNGRAVLDDTNDKIKILSDKAAALGLKRSYFQELPERTADDLLSRIVNVERYNIMYNPYREDMKKCVQYFAVCKSNQVSVSHLSLDHLLENVRRLYMLAPFLYMLTDNSTGFSEGQAFSGHAGMSLRHNGLLEGRGGVLPYVFTAQSGEELVSNHVNHVMNNPLFMYYNQDGSLTGVPSGDWGVTFETLKERGLNIASNYYLAQSLLWPDVKIATLKDDGGAVNGHRFEARMFGVGLHQHQTAFIITSALAFHETFGQEVNDLLEKYGFGGALQDTYSTTLEAYSSARNHDGKFFEINYGTGHMANFAKEFADLIEGAAEDMGMAEEAQAMLNICRTGCTDGKVNRVLFPTLDDVLNIQKSYDPDIFNNPNQSARMAFEKELFQGGHTQCDTISAA